MRPAATERTILNLARVFRYALDATQHDLVPLRDEIDAVRAYLKIEAERFEEQLRFEIAVPEDVYDVRIPPMRHLQRTHPIRADRRKASARVPRAAD